MSYAIASVLGVLRREFAYVREELDCSARPLRVVLGVSGGCDSTVLLHALVQLKEELALELVVCHVDHGLREQSAEDAEFVATLATRYDLPFFLYTADEKPSKENLEAWAREVRYSFFAACREESDAALVISAHHKNDQAETVLMRFLNGRTASSASGIARFDRERRLLRPLLSINRKELEYYATEQGLVYVHDETNEDLSRMRNYLRRELLPQLSSSVNPRMVDNLITLGERFREDEEVIASNVQRVMQDAPDPSRVDFLMELPPALCWRVLRALAEQQIGGEARKLGYAALGNAVEVVRGDGRRTDLGFGISCKVIAGRVEFATVVASLVDEKLQREALVVPGQVAREYSDGSRAFIEAKVVRLDTTGALEEELGRRYGDPEEIARSYFDADCLNLGQLSVRERSDGDVVRVWQRGRRSLKKLFQERALRLTLRDRLPIVELGGDIIWVPGVARSDIAPITPESENVLSLVYRREIVALEHVG